MSYNSPFKMRVWHNNQMQMVQTLCHNQGGAMWYAAGNAFGWAWINEEYDGWTADNPKPSPADVSPVMRWSGMKDNQGVDIYEGDICCNLRGFASDVVEFNWFLGWSDQKVMGWCTRDILHGTVNIGLESGDAYPKSKSGNVIGNIYANPEIVDSAKEVYRKSFASS